MVTDLPCNGFGYAAELTYEVPVATNIALSTGVKLLISVFGFSSHCEFITATTTKCFILSLRVGSNESLDFKKICVFMRSTFDCNIHDSYF